MILKLVRNNWNYRIVRRNGSVLIIPKKTNRVRFHKIRLYRINSY